MRISAVYGFGMVETGRLVFVETFPAALMVVAEPAEEELTCLWLASVPLVETDASQTVPVMR